MPENNSQLIDSIEKPISENTPIRIGLLIAFIAVFSGAIWWAATITSKLDSILAAQTTTTTTLSELKSKDISLDEELSDIKLKQALSDVEIKTLKEKILIGR